MILQIVAGSVFPSIHETPLSIRSYEQGIYIRVYMHEVEGSHNNRIEAYHHRLTMNLWKSEKRQ